MQGSRWKWQIEVPDDGCLILERKEPSAATIEQILPWYLRELGGLAETHPDAQSRRSAAAHPGEAVMVAGKHITGEQ
jgi:hypothetical protein